MNNDKQPGSDGLDSTEEVLSLFNFDQNAIQQVGNPAQVPEAQAQQDEAPQDQAPQDEAPQDEALQDQVPQDQVPVPPQPAAHASVLGLGISMSEDQVPQDQVQEAPQLAAHASVSGLGIAGSEEVPNQNPNQNAHFAAYALPRNCIYRYNSNQNPNEIWNHIFYDPRMAGLDPRSVMRRGNNAGRVTPYSPRMKQERIENWKKKRPHRNYTKKIRYVVRKTQAESRLREKGRFVKNNTETEAALHPHGSQAFNQQQPQPSSMSGRQIQPRPIYNMPEAGQGSESTALPTQQAFLQPQGYDNDLVRQINELRSRVQYLEEQLHSSNEAHRIAVAQITQFYGGPHAINQQPRASPSLTSAQQLQQQLQLSQPQQQRPHPPQLQQIMQQQAAQAHARMLQQRPVQAQMRMWLQPQVRRQLRPQVMMPPEGQGLIPPSRPSHQQAHQLAVAGEGADVAPDVANQDAVGRPGNDAAGGGGGDASGQGPD